MDYNYESLLDQRFQMFCQALLLPEYPNLQCMPVAMPDGGRDASSSAHSGHKSLVVFQVKYARNPSRIEDVTDWVIKAIAGELEKIKKLADRGLSQYILVTNARGTSHLDTGTIDKVQEYINSNLPCPGSCMWRDDLDRRLDNNFNLKLRYPSLIDGTDALRLMIDHACQGEGTERRQRALNSYLGHQYTQDRVVRFKQADLPANSLFKLFVDVPILPPRRRDSTRRAAMLAYEEVAWSSISAAAQSRDDPDQDIEIVMERSWPRRWDAQITYLRNGTYHAVDIGAASLLLHAQSSDTFSQIVVEGAPGQGKSTLAQYLAQVHRFRLIPRPTAEDRLPQESAKSALNLPFKLELRDVAQWLEGYNPWEAQPKTLHNRPRSLESAIAGHVEKYSGGVPFDAGDFLMALTAVPVLLILDALDEVANLDQRRRVVDEIEACASRLKQQACDVRIIVTSRPTAIADSPTFSDDNFTHFTLAPLSANLALTYADRWAIARRLDATDRAEVRRILRTKLSAPHMAELSKNTMQLSILLNLIHLRGESLPDKRTELYDKYIDVFFMREAEKSATVKRYTELLIDIHRYLGYYLHAKAELDQSTGRISYSELKVVVSDYLESEGQSTDAIDDLLFGMVQRVVALVSRVEGTYEFEVQPLREYFAARHLYDSASYSPAGEPKSGTKPDRFDGIARNSYWLNVTRFFGGCFSKGELLDLADRLDELVKTPALRSLTYPRMLGIALLQDWVFTQSPRATEKAVQAIFDSFGLRWASIEALSHGSSRSISDVSVHLTTDTGALPLLPLAWDKIRTAISNQQLYELRRYFSGRTLESRIWALWSAELVGRTGKSRAQWFQTGAALRVFSRTPWAEVTDVLQVEDGVVNQKELAAVVDGGLRIEVLPEEYRLDAVRSILDQNYHGGDQFSELARSCLDVVRHLSTRDMWILSREGPMRKALFGLALSYSWPESLIEQSPVIKSLHSVAEKVKSSIDDGGLAVWHAMTDDLTKLFGKTWLAVELAVISGSRSTDETYVRAPSLLSNKYSMVDRIRSCRRRSGNLSWWLEQIKSDCDAYDLGFWALALYTWASPSCMTLAVAEFDRVISSLDIFSQRVLTSAFLRSMQYSRHAGKPLGPFNADELSRLNIATMSILMHRMNPSEKYKIVRDRLIQNLQIPCVADSVLAYLSSEISAGNLRNSEGLEWVKKCYAADARIDVDTLKVIAQAGPSKKYEPSFASHVLEDCWEMPSEMVLAAIRSVGNKLPRAVPVGRIAQIENWFPDE